MKRKGKKKNMMPSLNVMKMFSILRRQFYKVLSHFMIKYEWMEKTTTTKNMKSKVIFKCIFNLQMMAATAKNYKSFTFAYKMKWNSHKNQLSEYLLWHIYFTIKMWIKK